MDFKMPYLIEQAVFAQGCDILKSRLHGPDGMGTGGAYSNLKKVEDTDGHWSTFWRLNKGKSGGA